MILDDRKAKVLRAVVEEHIETGLPVGSRVIARRYRLGVSPATIRNEMADLEETGYLDKPHTSSGRVPSDAGYRFYVDELMPRRSLLVSESRRIESLFRSKVKDVVSLLRQTVKSISLASNYLGFVLGPESETVTYQSIHLLYSAPGRAVLVAVTDIGMVESCVIDVPAMSKDELQHVSDLLSRNLTGVALEKVSGRAYDLLHAETYRYSRVVDQVVSFLEGLMVGEENDRLYLGGTANLLSQPEFRDVDKVREILRVVESTGVIQAMLIGATAEEPAIRIGRENDMDAVKDLSLVFSSFCVGNTEGKVGVLGPKRMDYSRVVALVRQFEKQLTEYFSQ